MTTERIHIGAVMERAAESLLGNDRCGAELTTDGAALLKARAALAELIEDLTPIANGTVGRGQFTALDLIHEYQRIVRVALARIEPQP